MTNGIYPGAVIAKQQSQVLPVFQNNTKTQDVVNNMVGTQGTIEKSNIISQTDFNLDVDKLKQAKGFDSDTAFNETIKYYKAKGLTVKGFESSFIEPELPQIKQPENIDGLDIGVKAGEGLRDIGQSLKPFTGDDFDTTYDPEDNAFQRNAKLFTNALKGIANLPGDTVQLAGDLIGLASNPIGTTKSLLDLGQGLSDKLVRGTLNTLTGQDLDPTENQIMVEAIGTEIGKLAKNPQRLQELTLENPTDVLLAVTGGVSIAKNIAKTKKLTGLVDKLQIIEDATNPLKIQLEAAKVAGKTISGVGEGVARGVTKITGMDFDTVKNIVKNPELFRQAEVGTLTRQSVADDVVKAIEKRARDVSDIGKEYNTIRKFNTNLLPDDIKLLKTNIDDFLNTKKITIGADGKLNFSNSNIGAQASRTGVQRAYDLLHNRTAFDKGDDILNLRNSLDDLVDYKTEVGTRGQTLIKQLRKQIDDVAKDRLDGLKKLDAKFGPERAELNRIYKLVFDKTGDLKDDYISKIATITGKGKELKLDRISKIIPNIEAQVNTLKALEDVTIAGGNKIGAYAAGTVLGGSAVGIGSGGLAVMPALITYILTRPRTLVNVLKAYNVAAKTITSISNKVKNGIKLNADEAAKVGEAIKAQVKETGANLADDLADKIPGVKSKLMQETGKKLDDFKKVGTTGSAKNIDIINKNLVKIDKDLYNIIDNSGKKVGSIAYENIGDNIIISGIKRDNRLESFGKGLPTKVIKELENITKSKGGMIVAKSSTKGKLFWEGLGFKQIGTQHYKDFTKTIINDKGLLDTINPTGGLYVDYTPLTRATQKINKTKLTTLDKTIGGKPTDDIIIYRGAPKNQKTITPGDFITDNYDLAKSYAGNGKVLEKMVKQGDILDDIKVGGGNEYIYRPNAYKEIK